jgi:hypothetical protein
MADSGRPGTPGPTPEWIEADKRANEQAHKEYEAEQKKIDEEEGLIASGIGMLAVGMGYQGGDPPPPPPPPPTGDQTGINPDVIPIAGDSSSTEDQIYADPGLGERGDPPPPPTQPPEPQPVIDDDVRRAANENIPEEFLSPSAQLNTRPNASPRPIIPIIVGGLLLIGVVGFAATRGTPEQGSAASVAPAPAVTVPPAATPVRTATQVTPNPTASIVTVTSNRIDEQGNVCLNATTMTFVAQVTGAKAGDSVHLKITGPGLPNELNGSPLDANGNTSTVLGTVGPVKGNQSWTAQIDQIAGKPIVNGPSQVFGFCPTG